MKSGAISHPDAPGYVPTPAQRLLLQAAGADAETARAAWARWRERCEPGSTDAASTRLLPRVYSRRELLAVVSADIPVLEEIYRYTWLRNQRLANAAAQVVHALQAEKIEVLLLKGLSLLITGYDDIGERYMDDFDFMIRPADVERAVAVLETLGWKPVAPQSFSPGARRWRHSAELHQVDGLGCDIHWRLSRRPNAPVSEELLWSSRVPLSLREERAFTICAEHMLVHLFVHGISWQRVPAIRWILDAQLLCRRQPPDWQKVIAESRRRGVILPVKEAMGILEDVFPGSVPKANREQVAQIQPTRRQRLAHQQVTIPYEQATWWVKWSICREGLYRAMSDGTIRPGLRGAIQYLCMLWRIQSPFSIPWELLKRIRQTFVKTR